LIGKEAPGTPLLQPSDAELYNSSALSISTISPLEQWCIVFFVHYNSLELNNYTEQDEAAFIENIEEEDTCPE